jgi:serine/threonine protein kinase
MYYEIKLMNKDSIRVQSKFLDFLKQISNGCVYLEEQNIVHRDLAARNCLLDNSQDSNQIIVKLSDLGLARKVYTNDAYKTNNKRSLPFKWMAPESIFHQEFTTKSDVWSFGILAFEVFSFGEDPYAGIKLYYILY